MSLCVDHAIVINPKLGKQKIKMNSTAANDLTEWKGGPDNGNTNKSTRGKHCFASLNRRERSHQQRKCHRQALLRIIGTNGQAFQTMQTPSFSTLDLWKTNRGENFFRTLKQMERLLYSLVPVNALHLAVTGEPHTIVAWTYVVEWCDLQSTAAICVSLGIHCYQWKAHAYPTCLVESARGGIAPVPHLIHSTSCLCWRGRRRLRQWKCDHSGTFISQSNRGKYCFASWNKNGKIMEPSFCLP